MNKQVNNIAVLGLWHLGEIYSACLAEIGHTVVGISDDTCLIDNFRKNIAPLSEPLLEDLLKKNQSISKLSYSTDFSLIKDADVLWLTFDVPVNDEDVADLGSVQDALKQSIKYLQNGVTVAVSSQLPVGTSAKLIRMIQSERPDLRFEYFYSPENLRLGEGVKSFMDPKRIVVGGNTDVALQTAKTLFAPLAAEIVVMDIASAEMAKHAVNAWLATSISFTNDLADACEQVGADVEDVVRALKAESRIGPKAYLFAGLGFSGGTLGRDLKALLSLARDSGIQLPLISSAYEKNGKRSAIVHNRLKEYFKDMRGVVFTICGITYKPGTSTLRRSMPLEIEKMLRKEGAILRLADTLALSHEVVQHTPSFFSADPYEAARGSEAILILSPDPRFRELDFKKLASMTKPGKAPILFDAQNILVQQESSIREAGFQYWRTGRRFS